MYELVWLEHSFLPTIDFILKPCLNSNYKLKGLFWGDILNCENTALQVNKLRSVRFESSETKNISQQSISFVHREHSILKWTSFNILNSRIEDMFNKILETATLMMQRTHNRRAKVNLGVSNIDSSFKFNGLEPLIFLKNYQLSPI